MLALASEVSEERRIGIVEFLQQHRMIIHYLSDSSGVCLEEMQQRRSFTFAKGLGVQGAESI